MPFVDPCIHTRKSWCECMCIYYFQSIEIEVRQFRILKSRKVPIIMNFSYKINYFMNENIKILSSTQTLKCLVKAHGIF